MAIARLDRLLHDFEKPAPAICSNLVLAKNDLLVFCCGFEDRAINSLNVATRQGGRKFQAINFEYLPHLQENRLNGHKKPCEDAGVSYRTLLYNRHAPAGIWNEIQNIAESIEGRIYIDISGMSRLLIAQLVKEFVDSRNGFSKVTVLYTRAINYSPTREEAEARFDQLKDSAELAISFMSSGVYEVTVVPELSSISAQTNPIRLIAYPSMNPSQLASVWSVVQPASVTLIYGHPPEVSEQWRTDFIKQINDLPDITDVQEFRVDEIDYRGSVNLIAGIYGESAALEKFVISPTGSKMQTVGVAIAKAFIKDLQVLYPTPLRYQEPGRYTVGASQLFSLDLDSVIDLHRSQTALQD